MPEICRTVEDEDVSSAADHFSPENAASLMLRNGALRFRRMLDVEATDARLVVDCSDVFVWGCTDDEDLHFLDIENLYKFWRKDAAWGGAVWCMIQRKEMPQEPVEKDIRAKAIWDLDGLRIDHALRPNSYDGMSFVRTQRQYRVYSVWEIGRGRRPLPFDRSWWEGWHEYVAEHLDWYDAAWRAEDDRLCNIWLRENGFELVIAPSD